MEKREDVWGYAVATPEEAEELYTNGIKKPILILGYTPPEYAANMIFLDITQEVHSLTYAQELNEALAGTNYILNVHLKLDTGMTRIGFFAYDNDRTLDELKQAAALPHLHIEGVFMHFCVADSRAEEDVSFTKLQYKRFMDMLSAMEGAGIRPEIRHCCNSGATILYTEFALDMVRPGIALYGLHPCPETRTMIELKPVMSVHARVTDARLVPMSEGVSYGMNYRSPGSVKICTVPVGYADGLRRGLSGRTDFIVSGQRFRQVGNICMDQCMFEVDMRIYGTRRRVDPQIGDEVVLVGRQGDSVVTLDDMANTLGTIHYELSIGFAQRMPRVYV